MYLKRFNYGNISLQISLLLVKEDVKKKNNKKK